MAGDPVKNIHCVDESTRILTLDGLRHVDDLKTGKILTDWTSVSAAANVTITITAANNEIQDEASRLETKQLIVQADAGLTTQVNGRVTWKVRNVRGIDMNS